MEKKNTVLLTVIAVATLLVAVVGATFAYFTATSTDAAAGNSDVRTTETIAAGTIQLLGADATNSAKLEYPGGMGVFGYSTQLQVTDVGTGTTYQAAAGASAIGFTITNNTGTALNYSVHTIKAASDPDVTVSCTSHIGETISETTAKGWWYSGCSSAATGYDSATVTKTGGTEASTTSSVAANGTVSATVPSLALSTVADTTAATANNKAYYYLVVEYPNSAYAAGSNQNADQNKTISVQFTGATAPTVTTSAS